MKMCKFLLLVNLFIISFIACKKQLSSEIQNNWNLQSWTNHTIPDKSKATLKISNKTIAGISFCNTYGGSISQSGKSVKIAINTVTLMACTDLANQESDYLSDLASIDKAEVVNGNLQLSKNGALVFVFSKNMEK